MGLESGEGTPCPAPPVPDVAPTGRVGREDEAGEVNVAHQHAGVGFLRAARGC